MIITELQEKDRPIWDAYVENSAHGLPMHLSGWRDVMSKTYGYETHYLMATEGEEIVGVLPLYIVRSFLVGNSATTMPGGLCADDPEVAAALIDRGKQVAQRAKAKRLVLQDTRRTWPGDLRTTSHHFSWVVDVRIGSEAVWKQLNRYTRREVRRARKRRVTVEIDRTGKRLREFHDVLSRFTHQIGAPFFGRDFLEHIVETFPGGFVITMVYKEKQPVGAYFLLIMGNTLWGTWGATRREYLKLGAAYLAYWEILNDAAVNEHHFVDLGRSPARSGASEFKSKWGGVSRPVHQQVAAIGNHHSADSIVDRVESDSKFQHFMQVWPKLPFPLVQFLGPRLRRHVPFA